MNRVNNKIKVLIVDDSLLFRELLSRELASESQIEIVAKAIDPFDARDKILIYHPDVMICDVEMPRMNGVEFIRRLLPQYPIPVIVVSSISEAVFDAMNAGAMDFIVKPNAKEEDSVNRFMRELVRKIKIATTAKTKTATKIIKGNSDFSTAPVSYDQNKVIFMGASTGGTEALFNIISMLPPTLPGIVIVQHIPAQFSRMFAQRLNDQTKLSVKEAENGDKVLKGTAIVAPGDKHVRIKKTAAGYVVQCANGEKVNGHCPSVDVLFESAASEVGKNAIGVILTGMGSDGAMGLLHMRKNGARTIGQDEKTSVVYGMPRVAFTIGAVERQAPLSEIPSILHGLLKK